MNESINYFLILSLIILFWLTGSEIQYLRGVQPVCFRGCKPDSRWEISVKLTIFVLPFSEVDIFKFRLFLSYFRFVNLRSLQTKH